MGSLGRVVSRRLAAWAAASALLAVAGCATTAGPRADAPDAGGAEAGAASPGESARGDGEVGAGRGPLAVARESIFGDASRGEFTPLYLRDLLTEGWDAPFRYSPDSESGAPRQAWIDAANGVFYRQWVLDEAYRNQVGRRGDRDVGSAFLYAPLNRRLDLYVNQPFVDESRLTGRPEGTVGDLVATPEVLLRETRNNSILASLAVRAPTGERHAGNGRSSIGPQLQFWQGLPRRWVVRGALGPTAPLDAPGLRTTVDANLTVGKYLTLDDAPHLRQFAVYLAANASTSVDDRGPNATTVTVLPGLRFRLAGNCWFLAGVETSLAGPGNERYALIVRLVRRF